MLLLNPMTETHMLSKYEEMEHLVHVPL